MSGPCSPGVWWTTSVHVTCVVESEMGETISRAWTSCGDQAAVDVRASVLVALGLQHTFPQQIGLFVGTMWLADWGGTWR